MFAPGSLSGICGLLSASQVVKRVKISLKVQDERCCYHGFRNRQGSMLVRSQSNSVRDEAFGVGIHDAQMMKKNIGGPRIEPRTSTCTNSSKRSARSDIDHYATRPLFERIVACLYTDAPRGDFPANPQTCATWSTALHPMRSI